ncbi:MAG: peptidoglycan-binding protein LysM [Pseudomonadota bacterium]
MSLFGFVKDIGRRVFNKDEEAAEKIKEHIEANNPGVGGLEVYYEMNGVVTLEGRCVSQEAREKVILMAGNIEGVTQIGAKNLTAPPPAPKPEAAAADLAESDAGASAAQAEEEDAEKAAEIEGTQFYTIKSGDTLGAIAKEFYGNAMEYPRIFEANREIIEDPNKIYPGQKIRIPAK